METLKSNQLKKGITFLEILIVIVIIGLLAAVAIPALVSLGIGVSP